LSDRKSPEKLYFDEISLDTHEELSDYILLNLRKILDHRRQFNIPIIGIAGTEGKSTTKRMLATILSRFGNVLETPLDCSTASAVTATLLKLNKSHQYAILELGIINPQQFELAVSVAEPNIGIVTNIGEAHLASQGDKYLIADAKVELVRNLPEDGFAILNMDDDLVSAMDKFSHTRRIIKFGLNTNAHFYASNIRYLGPAGIEFLLNDFYRFHLHVYSSAFIYNALAAISAARVLGIEFSSIREVLEEKFNVLEHRGNLITAQDMFFLDYTYDATTNSISKACESLVQFRPYSNLLVLVIGDIRDPGPRVSETHLKAGYYISALPIDVIITVGEGARFIAEGIRQINHTNKIVKVCREPEEVPSTLQPFLEPRTTVLMTGSRNLRLDRLWSRVLPAVGVTA